MSKQQMPDDFDWIKTGTRCMLVDKSDNVLKRNLTISQEPSFLHDIWVTFLVEERGFVDCSKLKPENGMA
jgi:hypothetical protein